jgi:hypothetical protein
MKLDDFVAESLKQIIKGVVEAQNFGNSYNAKINPSNVSIAGSPGRVTYCSGTGVPLQYVEFDVAVTIAEENQAIESGQTVGYISVSPANFNSSQNSSISRIKFEVPVLLPITE